MVQRSVAVFGASGGTGRAFVSAALERGYSVRVLLRPSTQWSAPPGIQVHRGSLGDVTLLDSVVGDVGAVCSFLGPRPPSTDVFCAAATGAILDAMSRGDVPRFLCVTGAMIDAKAPSVSVPARALAWLLGQARAAVAADRARQEALVKASATVWTLFKPPRLRSTPPTGRVAVGPEVRIGLLSAVSRGDLATTILDALQEGRFVRQSVYVRAAA